NVTLDGNKSCDITESYRNNATVNVCLNQKIIRHRQEFDYETFNSCVLSPVVPPTSCRGRCFEPFDGEVPGCRCDSSCNNTHSCCYDYYDILEQWECTRLRCGEKRLSNSKCHCSDDCAANGDCCTNYNNVCKGEKLWVQGACDDLYSPQCPPG
uniref:SMB domain-containing protein n=1 Tax=Periophthalmus magnuspinnatus TaxID=409849 RepID=A0A3B4AIM0_9GOBI